MGRAFVPPTAEELTRSAELLERMAGIVHQSDLAERLLQLAKEYKARCK